MTTIGSEDGRNYARVNLRLVERKDRKRSQKEIERAIRTQLKPVPGIELAFGFDRPVWVNLLGPDPETLTALITDFSQKVAKGESAARVRRPTWRSSSSGERAAPATFPVLYEGRF
jgi:hypothetical protein